MKRNILIFLTGAAIFTGCSTPELPTSYEDLPSITDFYKPQPKKAPQPAYNSNIREADVIPETSMEIQETNPNETEKDRFAREFKETALKTREDPYYKRIGLKTADNKLWFKELSYSLWKGEISKQEFVDAGVARFPDNKYEFVFVANNLKKN